MKKLFGGVSALSLFIACPALAQFSQGQGTGTGSVTSIGLTMPSAFSCAPSSITTAGIFACTFASETANQVLIAPNGSNGVPTFRAIVQADLPASAAPYVYTTAALALLPSTFSPIITRKGYIIGGDSPAVDYVSSPSACSLNSGAGDGGYQIPSSDGKCWIANFNTFGGVPLAAYGLSAPGNDNSGKIQAAYNATALTGLYRVIVPPITIDSNSVTFTGINNVSFDCGAMSAGPSGTTPGASFRPLTLTQNLFNVSNAAGVYFRNCSFRSTQQQTAGIMLNFSGTNNAGTENALIYGAYTAMTLTNTGDMHFTGRFETRSSLYDDVYINGGQDYFFDNFVSDEDAQYYNTSASTASGAVLPMTQVGGLFNGMFVFGTNIPAGAQIIGIAGNNVTLSASISGAVASGALITFESGVNKNACFDIPQSGGTLVVSSGDALHCHMGLALVPTGTQFVNWVDMSNMFFDTCNFPTGPLGGSALFFNATAGGKINGGKFSNVWGATCNIGLFSYADGASVIDGNMFVNSHFVNNQQNGIYAYNNTGLMLSQSEVGNNSLASTGGYSGILIDGLNTTKIDIHDSRVGAPMEGWYTAKNTNAAAAQNTSVLSFASASGIVAGMNVTGAYIQGGTTVSSVAAGNVMISLPVLPGSPGIVSGQQIVFQPQTQAFGIQTTSSVVGIVRIHDNDLGGNSAGPIAFGAAFAPGSYARNNSAYNPVGASALSPGATPWTYTAGPTEETLVTSATVTQNAGIGGQQFCITAVANAQCTITLAPFQSAQFSYSGALTGYKSAR